MRQTQLEAIVRSNLDDCIGGSSGELANERAEALDRYHGRPLGNEVVGQSQIVSRDLSEAIGWAMPSLMQVFTKSGNIAEFRPVGPEDVQLAQQDTDYVNHVLMTENNGFMVLHDAFHDALLLKNGYVKHCWDVATRTWEAEYTGLMIEQVQQMMQKHQMDGVECEISGQEIDESGPIPLISMKLKCTKREGRCRIEAVPAEELRISKDARGSLQDAHFVAHVSRKTRSELLEMGIPRDFVESAPAYRSYEHSSEEYKRDTTEDENDDDGAAFGDRSMDVVEYVESYLLVDYDGDGVAERRLVVTIGDKIPPGEDWNKTIPAVPITSMVAKRVPHRHVGESLHDEMADLIDIMTTLKRQMLDNVYRVNHSQMLANERVSLEDLMQKGPGGIKRVRGMEPVTGSVEPLVTPSMVGDLVSVIGFFTENKEQRTGISRASTGLDPDSLQQSTKGAFLENLNRASQKLEMMARMLAETGVKELVVQVHGILRRHQDVPKMVQLRGQWVQVNPAEWRDRTDVVVKVGLGTGNAEEKQQKLMLMAELQDRAATFGLVDPQHVYSLTEELAKSMGFDMPDKFLLSPQSPQFAQKMQNPPPNPMVQVEQAKMAQKQQEFQASMQLEAQKAQNNMAQEQARSQNDVAIEREKIAAQMELERYKAQLQAQTQLQIKQMELAANERASITAAQSGGSVQDFGQPAV